MKPILDVPAGPPNSTMAEVDSGAVRIAAKVAATIPKGQRLRLAGLGHGGACAASALTAPTARAFLDRWLP